MAQEWKHHRWEDLIPHETDLWVKYPWDEWLNGSAWFLKQGDDFEPELDSFRRQIYRYCSYHGISIRTRLGREPGTLWIKAIKGHTKGRGYRKRRHWEALERRRQDLEERGLVPEREIDAWEPGKFSVSKNYPDATLPIDAEEDPQSG